MIQVFGTKKCRDTQKALRFFKERGAVSYTHLDVYKRQGKEWNYSNNEPVRIPHKIKAREKYSSENHTDDPVTATFVFYHKKVI